MSVASMSIHECVCPSFPTKPHPKCLVHPDFEISRDLTEISKSFQTMEGGEKNEG